MVIGLGGTAVLLLAWQAGPGVGHTWPGAGLVAVLTVLVTGLAARMLVAVPGGNLPAGQP